MTKKQAPKPGGASPVVHSRMSEQLHKWLVEAAAKDGRTVSSFMERLVQKEVARQKAFMERLAQKELTRQKGRHK